MAQKKSLTQKKLEGTARADRISGDVGDCLTLEPQSFITEKQRPFFDAIVEHLNANNATQKIDTFVVSQCAYYLWVFHESATRINKSGELVQTFENGTQQVHPNITNLQKANEKLEKLFDRLGMDPKSRSQLDIFQKKSNTKKDALSDLLK